MIQEIHTIVNNHVQVAYASPEEVVIVAVLNPITKNIERQRMFSGFDGIKEMFHCYRQSFSEDIDFETTINFFKPNIQSTNVNAPIN
jgi:hypothetical protein